MPEKSPVLGNCAGAYPTKVLLAYKVRQTITVIEKKRKNKMTEP